MDDLKDKATIVGVGETEYNRDSGRTELSLAVEAAKNAIADAGLLPGDIDGMVKFSVGSTSQGELAACLGIPYLRYYGELGPLGGAACGLVLQAALAVSRGMANNVLVYPVGQRPIGAALRLRRGHHPEGREELRIHRALRPAGARTVQRSAVPPPHA